ncbi:Methylase_S domain-containing protein [Vibrio owensii]|uniref:restriction endonuclease subunit S n=1 Tax=Vibrio owensii TaxID=696485 RepID=UPI0028962BF6|nr:Methylase_S domain-containing protein [Vibrio owensii]
MGKYQSYPDYSKTNNRWLDKIPSHWHITQIKHIVSTRVTDGPHSTPEFLDEGVPFVSAEAVSGGFINFDKIRGYISEKDDEAFSQKYRPQKHDVYMVKSGATTGVTAIVETDQRFNIWSPLAVMRCASTYNPYFLLNSLRSDYFQKSVQLSWTFGTQQNIGMGTLENLSVCYPPLEEQVQIANFLDHETAKIDTLIEKQQQLIKLLKEKRQAVISHAVTKGLNPQAPMKDSGVEWLGEVPEHWVVSPLKLYISTRKGVAFKSADFCDSGIKVVKASDIKQKTIREPHIFLPTNFMNDFPNAVLNAGDIVLSTVGSAPEVKNSAVGQIGMVPNHLAGSLLNQNTVVFTPRNALLSQNFLFYLIQTDMYRDHLDLHAHGTANQASLNVADMLNFMFAMPSYKEQLDIVSHIEISNLHFDKLENQCSNAITLLTERRTALISAAVTGKIDVRNWQAPISQDQALEQTA